MQSLREYRFRPLVLTCALFALAGCGGAKVAAPVAVNAVEPVAQHDDPTAQAAFCWTGQKYDLKQGRCVGDATRCPSERMRRDGSCWLRSSAARVVVGDRVRLSVEGREAADDGDVFGFGTVIRVDRRNVMVQWDSGAARSHRFGDDGAFDVEVVADAPAIMLGDRYRVVAGPSCRKCPERGSRGVVDLLLDNNRVRVIWDDGSSGEAVVGIGGVLPAGGPHYPLLVGDRVGRGPRFPDVGKGRWLGTVVNHDADDEYAGVRWDDGVTGNYKWSSPEESAIAILDGAPPLKIPLGWRVTAGPNCMGCSSGVGEVIKVLSDTDLEVAWPDAKSSTFTAGVSGVLPVGPPLPKIAVGTRVERGPGWRSGEQDQKGRGTVIRASTDGYAWVQWDAARSGRYLWGDRGLFELTALPKEGPAKVKAGDTVVAGPGCKGCPVDTQGTVVKPIGAGKAKITWARGGTQVLPLGVQGVLKSGPMPTNIAIGDRVIAGPDWQWGTQGDGGTGTVTAVEASQWVSVRWDNGDDNGYRWGSDGKYDLTIVGHVP